MICVHCAKQTPGCSDTFRCCPHCNTVVCDCGVPCDRPMLSALRADVDRAVRTCFPDRADKIMDMLERREAFG